jgi:hypothetical protein
VASIGSGTVLDSTRNDEEFGKVIKVTYSPGQALEGTRLASAAPNPALTFGCINPNYLKCHL